MKVCLACAHRFTAREWKCPRCNWTVAVRDGVHLLTPSHEDGASGFEAGFFTQVDEAERNHFWFHGRLALIGFVLDRFFPHARTFLDVGSGTGHVVAGLRRHRPSMRFTAAEALMAGLQMTAQRTSDVELVQTDALHLPYDAEFDVVGAFDVIEHIADDLDAVQEMVRAMRPDGGLILTVPQHAFLWSPYDEHVHHQRRYSRAGLSLLLDRAGCEIVFATSFVSFLLPAMFLARVVRRARRDDPLSEFRVSRIVNAIGHAVSRVERWVIRSGGSFPVGGSLLVVARRKPE